MSGYQRVNHHFNPMLKAWLPLTNETWQLNPKRRSTAGKIIKLYLWIFQEAISVKKFIFQVLHIWVTLW